MRFQPEISTFCHFRTVWTLFSYFQQSARLFTKQTIWAREQHVLSFSHWAHHFLAIFNKVPQFVQNSVFSPRSARTVIFAVDAPLFHSFQQSARVSPKSKTALLARDQHVLSFSHCEHYLLVIFSKVHEFVHNSVFSPRSVRFVILALGATRFSFFQQSARVCTKLWFQPEIRRYYHFCTAPFFNSFQQSARVCRKQRFQPEISAFCHFRTGCKRFSFFQQGARVCTKQRFQREISRYCLFCTGCATF